MPFFSTIRRFAVKSLLILFVTMAGSCFTCGVLSADAQDEANDALFSLDHLMKLGDVSDVRPSPDGAWVAYTVSTRDMEEDESRSRVWMARVQGGEKVALTDVDESSWNPRWSPDGRHIAFLSARDDGETQVWSLYRGGGEAIQLSETPQSVETFEWSPDSTQLMLLLQDPTQKELDAAENGEDHEEETDPPWVIDRKQFKTDYVGYLDRRRTHIYTLDLASKELTQLTSGDFDDAEPAWSPDGGRIAFSSNRSEDPDGNYNTDIWTVSADGGDPVRVTVNPGPDSSPAWSPDASSIVHLSAVDTEAILYATVHLAISDSDGSRTAVLTEKLDRMIFSPRFSPDGEHIWFLLEDGGEQNLARISPRGGTAERLIRGDSLVYEFAFGKDDTVMVLLAGPHQPSEVFSWSGGKLSQISHVNDQVLDGLTLGKVEKIRFSSPDGSAIEGFVIKPPGFTEGKRYPAILDIHGGPQSQYDWSFGAESQLFAAQGYLVIHPNPRGSTGYGQDFCLAIWQDWGGPDYEDVMAAVDFTIGQGWADPDRLAVTGWSYGGILTNHVITKTDRFKAAITGASATLYVANYGHDMYQRWWDRELGLPWEAEARERYERISPFNRLDRVVTPTLILGGEKDWNVPIINSEQLYLALKKLGVETQLVVYPGEYHGIDTPSYEKDLYQRYLDWFGRHLGSK